MDGEAFRSDLEDAYAAILERESNDAPRQEADVQALASMPIPQHRTVDGALNYFTTTLKNSIQTSLFRSARYRAMIDRALDEHSLPRALAWLPVIESAYLPTLTSRVGAHGIWQFMPETARDYGLRVDWWIDERADPEASTRAAAAFLADLYRQFEDWPLALAAYNCGAGRVRRALERTGATTFWELLEMNALPKETRGYVPTFFATILIVSDPETHGFRLTEPEGDESREVTIDGPLSLAYLAEATGVDEKQLRDANPALHRGLVPPGRAKIRVPSHAAAQIASVASTLRREDEKIEVASFTIRKGDTLAKLAKKLGTTPSTIAAMNDLSPKAALRPGRSIYLPVQARRLGILLRHSDDREIFYAVRKGDTLYSIAKQYKLTVNDLRELNDLRKDSILKVGQKLRVSPPRGLTAGSM
ncbi:MAG TPA: LysM peptidoglycan-binding domain-containing protein [Thermoanaerobaculia bacterium]